MINGCQPEACDQILTRARIVRLVRITSETKRRQHTKKKVDRRRAVAAQRELTVQFPAVAGVYVDVKRRRRRRRETDTCSGRHTNSLDDDETNFARDEKELNRHALLLSIFVTCANTHTQNSRARKFTNFFLFFWKKKEKRKILSF